MKTCYIVCALDCKLDFTPKSEDYVIGADRGYEILIKNGIKPNCVIGDFDSYTGPIECESIIKFPVKKDFTDSALAIEKSISLGFDDIVIYGAIGGSLDHTIANIALLADYAEKNVNVAFIDGENALFSLSNGKISFSKEAKGRISVFSYGDKAIGVYEKGLLYELDNVELSNRVPLGVSNEFTGKESSISVSNGTLIIYTSKKNYKNYLTK